MTDDPRDDALIAAAADYNRPPAVPREAMWAKIEAAKRQAAGELAAGNGRRGTAPSRLSGATSGITPPLAAGASGAAAGSAMNGHANGISAHVQILALPRHRSAIASRWRLLRGLSIAAGIVIAVAIGRVTLDTAANEIASADRAPVAAEPAMPSAFPYEIAAAEHLDEAEALLGFFRAEVRRGDPEPATVEWAQDLVGTTRLFMDSPAAEDPNLHDLLQDLELVLVQIAQSADQDHSHVELIEQGIEEGNVMLRLTSSGPAGPTLRQE